LEYGLPSLPDRAALLQVVHAHAMRDLHTSAYVSIRQHTSAYASIRQHTLADRAALLQVVHAHAVRDLWVVKRVKRVVGE
jgi:hypothetical protein